MSAVEMVIEKVKQLDEVHARQLLILLQGQESTEAAALPPGRAMAQPDFLSRAKAVWGEQPEGKPLSQVVGEARGGQS